MNPASTSTPSLAPAAAPTATARDQPASVRHDEDDARLADTGQPPPSPDLLCAWQAALAARAGTLGPAHAAASVLVDASRTQGALTAVAQAGGAAPRAPAEVLAGALPVETVNVVAEFRPGSGAAWQLGLQRGPDAAAWSLNLSSSAASAAWATTLLPRLERRLRQQGHEVVAAHWSPVAGQPPPATPQGPQEDTDER